MDGFLLTRKIVPECKKVDNYHNTDFGLVIGVERFVNVMILEPASSVKFYFRSLLQWFYRMF